MSEPAPERSGDAVVRLTPPAGDRIALADVLARLRRRWRLIAGAVVVGLAVAAAVTATAPRLYTARMVVAAVGDEGAGALAGRLAQYAQVASLVGLNLRADQQVTNFDRFVRVIGSVALAERLDARYGLMKKVFAAAWDGENGRWRRPPSGLVGTLRSAVQGLFGMPDWAPPSTAQLAAWLRARVLVKGVLRSAMREIVFEHPDPEFALALVQWVYREGDDYLRTVARERAERQIAYIQDKLASVTVAEHRQALTEILAAQERGLMMMQVDLPFAVEVIEPATVSELPTWPRPLFNLALGLIGGLVAGLALALLAEAVAGRRGG